MKKSAAFIVFFKNIEVPDGMVFEDLLDGIRNEPDDDISYYELSKEELAAFNPQDFRGLS